MDATKETEVLASLAGRTIRTARMFSNGVELTFKDGSTVYLEGTAYGNVRVGEAELVAR